MKTKEVVMFILNNALFIKKEEQVEKLNVDKGILKYNRINNVKSLFKLFNNSKILKSSNKKLFSDKLYFIYFNDYTNLELQTLKNSFIEYGFDNINFLFFGDLLKYSRSTLYVIDDTNKYYIYTVDNYEVINKYFNNNNDQFFKLLISNYQFKEVILLFNNDLGYFKDIEQKYKVKCYVLDNDENYIFNLFTERNN